jgi:hypothetical protein
MNLEQLLNTVTTPRTKQCKLNAWLTTLSEEDRNAFWRAMDDERIPLRHIWKTIQAVGCPNQESSVRSHRRGDCKSCERLINNV